MPEEILKKVYEAGSQHYDLDDYDTFKQKMQDPEIRQKVFTGLSKYYDLDDFATFESKVGIQTPKEKTPSLLGVVGKAIKPRETLAKGADIVSLETLGETALNTLQLYSEIPGYLVTSLRTGKPIEQLISDRTYEPISKEVFPGLTLEEQAKRKRLLTAKPIFTEEVKRKIAEGTLTPGETRELRKKTTAAFSEAIPATQEERANAANFAFLLASDPLNFVGWGLGKKAIDLATKTKLLRFLRTGDEAGALKIIGKISDAPKSQIDDYVKFWTTPENKAKLDLAENRIAFEAQKIGGTPGEKLKESLRTRESLGRLEKQAEEGAGSRVILGANEERITVRPDGSRVIRDKYGNLIERTPTKKAKAPAPEKGKRYKVGDEITLGEETYLVTKVKDGQPAGLSLLEEAPKPKEKVPKTEPKPEESTPLETLTAKVKAGEASGEEIKAAAREAPEETEAALREEFKAAKTTDEQGNIALGIDIVTQEAGKKPKVPRAGVLKGRGGQVYEAKLYRGKPQKPSDPGDLGRGEYWTTDKSYAQQYGEITEETKKFKNALILDTEEAKALVNEYGTVQGNLEQRLNASQKLRDDLVNNGYDAIVVRGYETRPDHYTVVDLTTPSVKPTPKRGAPTGARTVRTAISRDPNLRLKNSEVEQIFGKGTKETKDLINQIGNGDKALDETSRLLQEQGVIEPAPGGYNSQHLIDKITEDAPTLAKAEQQAEKATEGVYGKTAKEAPKPKEKPTPPKPKGAKERRTYDELNVGDEFTINGEKFTVTGKELSPTGEAAGVKLKDSKSYEQSWGDFRRTVEFDEGSLKKAGTAKQGVLEEAPTPIEQVAKRKPLKEGESIPLKRGTKEYAEQQAKAGKKPQKITRQQKKEKFAKKLEEGKYKGDMFVEEGKARQTSLLETPTKPTGANIGSVQGSIEKYGWSAKENPNGTIEVFNRNNKKVAEVSFKEGKYTITDTSGKKLLSGNKEVGGGVEKVAKEYFYAKETPKQTVSERLTEEFKSGKRYIPKRKPQTPEAPKRKLPDGSDIYEMIGGRKKGVIDQRRGSITEKNVDALIDEGVDEITVRIKGLKKDRIVAERHLEGLGWERWEKDLSIWVSPERTSKIKTIPPPYEDLAKQTKPGAVEQLTTPKQNFRQFVESKGVKWEQVSGATKDEALRQKLFDEFNQAGKTAKQPVTFKGLQQIPGTNKAVPLVDLPNGSTVGLDEAKYFLSDAERAKIDKAVKASKYEGVVDEKEAIRLLEEPTPKKVKSGKEFTEGLLDAAKKDIFGQELGITPDPYRNLKKFLDENKLKLTDTERKKLMEFASNTAKRGLLTAEKRQQLIDEYIAKNFQRTAEGIPTAKTGETPLEKLTKTEPITPTVTEATEGAVKEVRPKTFRQLENKWKQPMGEKPSTTLGYNVEKMHPDLQESLPQIIENFREEFNLMRGERLTTQQAIDSAIEFAGNLTDDAIMKLKRGDVTNASHLLGARIYVNNRLLEISDKLSAIPKDASGKLIGEITAENKHVLDMYMRVRSLGTETARALRFMQIPMGDNLINGMKKYRDALAKIDPKSARSLTEIISDAEKLPTKTDAILFWWYNGMLSNPFTDLANITGNASHLTWEIMTNMAHKPKAIKQMFKGLWEGSRDGVRVAKAIYNQEKELLSKFSGDIGRARYDVYPKTKVGKFLRSALPTTRLAMEDAIFSSMAKQMRIGVESPALAKKLGVNPEDVLTTVRNIIENPKFRAGADDQVYRELAEYADKYAEYLTFRTPLKSKFLQGAQQTLWVKPFVPFPRVMANIAKAGFKNSPAGIIKLFGKDAKAMTVFERQDIARRALAGTAVFSGIGAMMAAGKIEVTGTGPESKKERELWDKMGYKPNHVYWVNSDGSKKGVSYQNINPFNVILAVMGNWQDQYRFGNKLIDDEKSFMAKLSYALGGAAATMTDQSFMQGISNLYDWIRYKDEKYLEDFFTKPFIPNIVGFPRNIKEYVTGEKPRYEARSWWERVKRRVGLYEGLMPTYSAYGGQKESGWERFPYFPSEVKKDRLLEHMRRNNVLVSVPSKRTMINNRIMTDEEYTDYVKISGDAIIKELRRNQNEIMNKNAEDAQDYVDKIVRDARKEVKDTIAERSGGTIQKLRRRRQPTRRRTRAR